MDFQLNTLYELQRSLDEHIESEHPRGLRENRLAAKTLALRVELGECCNEWRGFKFWSNRKTPNTYQVKQKWVGGNCFTNSTNPLLEEFVDCLHFLLSIGLEIGTKHKPFVSKSTEEISVLEQFNLVFDAISRFNLAYTGEYQKVYYSILFDSFIELGNKLGFSWEQVEQAYLDKNQINHQRQDQKY